jgi:D-hydroxyproline dehydrogenase subunit gamma
MSGRFVRLAETDRPSFEMLVDGSPVRALDGDTVLTAMLAAGTHVRQSEFGDGHRAGFCVMSACQDCWVWCADGSRLRACSTPARPGLSINTLPPDESWSLPG